MEMEWKWNGMEMEWKTRAFFCQASDHAFNACCTVPHAYPAVQAPVQ